MSKIIFEMNDVYVTKHWIQQDRDSGKDELFVTWDGYDFGVYQMYQLTRAIDAAVIVANTPIGERKT